MGGIQHLAVGVLELFQGQGGLAAARRTHHDQGRRQPVHGFLGIVEGDDLVQQVDFAPLRMHVSHRVRLGGGFPGSDVRELPFVHLRPAQEAGLVVGMVLDHFQHQRIDRVVMADDGEQQAIGVIQLGPVELAVGDVGELLDFRLAEIVAGNGVGHLPVLGLVARGVEAYIFEDFHDRGGREFRLRGFLPG